MKQAVVRLRLFYGALWLLVAVLAFLSEVAVLPVAYADPTPAVVYRLDVLAIVLALGGTYLALRFFAFKRWAARLRSLPATEAWLAYVRGATLRMFMPGVAALYNVVYYYALGYHSTALYLLLISLVALLFCWPSEGEFEKLRGQSVQ